LSLSFNNDGPLGTFFRYIGDTGTYIARYDDLMNDKEEPIDLSTLDLSMP
jgi:2-hydroxy-4-carboxymuconate semialdehyde hemiacetal dehydrogenase